MNIDVPVITTDLENSTPSTPTLSDNEAKKLLDDAIAAVDAGEVETAADNFLTILQAIPDHKDASAYLGAILLGLEQYDTAESLLFNAVNKSNWTDVASVINLAKAVRQRGDFEFALLTLIRGQNATESISTSLNIDLNLKFRLDIEIADTLYISKNYSQAARWYFSTALKYPTIAEPTLYLAASTLQYPIEGRDNTLAEAALLEGIQRHRDSSILIYYMGKLLFETDRINEAITFYEHALRLQPDYHDAVVALATAYHSTRQFQQAFKYYQQASTLMSENIIYLSNFARLLYAMGAQQDAINVITKAALIDSNHQEVLTAIQEMGFEMIRK
jgi:tetratricopeptide (TPR) repeat protein